MVGQMTKSDVFYFIKMFPSVLVWLKPAEVLILKTDSHALALVKQE